jgi:hypothetical protein
MQRIGSQIPRQRSHRTINSAIAGMQQRIWLRILVGKIDLDARDLLSFDLDVACLPLCTAHGLVNHDARMRKCQALALLAGGKEERSHRGGKADIDGVYGRCEMLDLHVRFSIGQTRRRDDAK